jgi:hypothetical protein
MTATTFEQKEASKNISSNTPSTRFASTIQSQWKQEYILRLIIKNTSHPNDVPASIS